MIYKIYNERVSTDLNLSHFFNQKIIGNKSFDLSITKKNIEFLYLEQSPEANYAISLKREYGEIFKKGFGKFILLEGRKIIYEPARNIPEINLILYIFTHIFGFLMYQRDYLSLHASSATKNGSSFFFCGRSGSGKSTIVSRFSNFLDPLAEDLCIISKKKNSILQSLPYLKVSDSEMKEKKFSYSPTVTDKRNRKIIKINSVKNSDNIIKAGFFCQIGEKVAIERIEKAEAWKNILSNCYCSDPVQASDQENLLKKIAVLVEKVDFYNIYRKNNSDFNFSEIKALLNTYLN